MYLVRPRDGRISTMKIKKIYTLVTMIRFSPDLQEARGDHSQGSQAPARCPAPLGGRLRDILLSGGVPALT